ncbi:hypothetical protein BDP81DRAFT_450817 [Colletotrichum phormii]|uniref:Uncharacterized protein n=1 Tax=Colletotrichum phormii TaxID=359342 RepID=A0AAI9ZQP0_9PEZI|nr:uncharacterized protein BDP81DRAFT_450817 [Colletotrichum phormii]KAK1635054.1 hypothetical protein BDP81DRAFT_450817 [Colletotrichum phormii]
MRQCFTDLVMLLWLFGRFLCSESATTTLRGILPWIQTLVIPVSLHPMYDKSKLSSVAKKETPDEMLGTAASTSTNVVKTEENLVRHPSKEQNIAALVSQNPATSSFGASVLGGSGEINTPFDSVLFYSVHGTEEKAGWLGNDRTGATIFPVAHPSHPGTPKTFKFTSA